MSIKLDSELCVLCAKLYASGYAWDVLWQEKTWGLDAAKSLFQNATVFVHRGSATPRDWFDDFICVDVYEDEALGSLPLGFAGPLRPWYEANKAYMEPDMILIGHSLGAARAVEHAAMLALDGMRPRAVVVWGEPRAGMKTLAHALEGIPVHSYRNRHDPVCDVPMAVWPLDWQHGHDVVALDAPPLVGDEWGGLADHHIELYVEGMKKLNPQPMV